LSSLCLLPD